MIGEAFIGLPGAEAAASRSRPLRHSVLRQACCFRRIRSSTSRSSLTIGVNWFMFRTRAGLTLRAIGDSHGSAHALGIKRHPHSLSGGAVRWRLRRTGRGSSVARLHAAMGGEHDRRPRLDRAGARGLCFLAAVACARRRLSVRRGLHRPVHAQAQGVGIPSQFLSALPYLAIDCSGLDFAPTGG
jgi:hypothetical protein